MIVRDEKECFVCIHQDEHARLSGFLAENWGDKERRRKAEFLTLIRAVAEHDRGWRALDDLPLWDEKKEAPYDFTNYPEVEKIKGYQQGIEEVAFMNARAAVLVSQHLQSFFKNAQSEHARNFLQGEEERCAFYGEYTAGMDEDLRILKMCDDLSLYACMNRPGVAKEEEFPWFQAGFAQRFLFLEEKTVQGKWMNETTISLTPFPLLKSIHFPLKYRIVDKEKISDKGWEAAYQSAELQTQKIAFTQSDGNEK